MEWIATLHAHGFKFGADLFRDFFDSLSPFKVSFKILEKTSKKIFDSLSLSKFPQRDQPSFWDFDLGDGVPS